MAHRSNLFVYFEISLSDGSAGISNLTSSLHCCKQEKNREFVNIDRDQSASSLTYHNASLQTSLIVSHFFLYILLGPIHWSWAPFNARLNWVDAAGLVLAALCCTQVHISLQHSNGNDVTFKNTRKMIVTCHVTHSATDTRMKHFIRFWQRSAHLPAFSVTPIDPNHRWFWSFRLRHVAAVAQ